MDTMAETVEFDLYEQYSRFATALMAEASKEELFRCARILALYLAQYRATFGELPQTGLLSGLHAERVGPDAARTMANGMRSLVDVLTSVSTHQRIPQ